MTEAHPCHPAGRVEDEGCDDFKFTSGGIGVLVHFQRARPHPDGTKQTTHGRRAVTDARTGKAVASLTALACIIGFWIVRVA